MLNYLWAGMMMLGIIYAAFTGHMPDITNAALDSSKEAITLCITMIGIMSFWVGLMEIATKAGIIEQLSRKLKPLIHFLFPNLPDNHPTLLLLFHCCFFDVTSLQLLLYNNFFHCAVISVNFLVTHLLEGTYFYEIFLASF